MCEKLFARNGWHAGITRASQLEKYTWIHLTLGMLYCYDPKATPQLRNERINQKGYQNKSTNCIKKCFRIPFEKCNSARSEAHDPPTQNTTVKKKIIYYIIYIRPLT